MKLVAMLRIKNQIDTISACLDKLSELVDEIVIVDNGSTDGTQNMYRQYPKIVAIKHTKGFHEGRDKILAHDMAKKRHPDWILWIDGDEVFERCLTRKDLNIYMNKNEVNLVQFRLFNLWRNESNYRIDQRWGYYTSQPQRQLWRNSESSYFANLRFHNGGIQNVDYVHITSSFRIKHYGYLNKEHLSKKYKQYLKLSSEPNSIKTMDISEDTLKLLSFKESNNRNINYVYRSCDDIFLRLLSFFYSIGIRK